MCSNTLASFFTNYSPVFKVIFHQTVISNFVTVSTLKILPRFAHVAALPCEILTMQLMLVFARMQCEIATVLSRFDVKALNDLVVKSNVSHAFISYTQLSFSVFHPRNFYKWCSKVVTHRLLV